MKVGFWVSLAVMGLVGLAIEQPVGAADIAALGWQGEFLLSQDNSVEAKSMAVRGGPANVELALELGDFQITADNEKTEGTSSFVGQLIVLKPANVPLPSLSITLEGHLVKTLGSDVRIDLTVGDFRKTFNWSADQTHNGVFREAISATPRDRHMKDPLPVSIVAWVTRPKTAGATLLTVDKLSVNVTAAASVASLSPDFRH
jgi:hypothetical protein